MITSGISITSLSKFIAHFTSGYGHEFESCIKVGMDQWFVFGALELRGVDLEEEGLTSVKKALLGLVSDERFLAIPFLPFTKEDIFLWPLREETSAYGFVAYLGL